MNQMKRAEQEAWARNAESVERMRMQQAIDLREQEKALENRLRRDRRERIATAVLAGFVGSPDVGGPKKDAAVAVAYADALIAELDKEPKP